VQRDGEDARLIVQYAKRQRAGCSATSRQKASASAPEKSVAKPVIVFARPCAGRASIRVRRYRRGGPAGRLIRVKQLAALLCYALTSPALADTALLDDGRWRVIGVDVGAEPQPIAVTQDGAGLGDFSALRIFFDLGAGFVPVLTLYAGGRIEPSLPPPAVPGATAVLGRYFECGAGLTPALRFVALELPEGARSGHLELGGTLSNGDSLASEKLKLRLFDAKPDRVRIELRYRLVATRDFCVDPERRDTQEEFRIVELATSYLSPAQHLSDLTRYVKAIDLDCDAFGDCEFDRISFCAPLENTTGYVIDSPNRLHDPTLALFHTTNAPAASPTLELELSAPRPADVKPQGFVSESDDPAVRNVSFWADWVDVKRDQRAGRKVGTFRFTLEAKPPRRPSCDRNQS